MNIAPEVQERIQLWVPHAGNKDQWPDWYRFDGGWYENDCENTVYANWPDIGPDSIVWDVGAYEGEWSRRIAEKYDPYLYLFEPAPRAFGVARERLGGNPKVRLFPFALGGQNRMVEFFDCNRDGAGMFSKGNPVMTVDMIPFKSALGVAGVENIDLMSLNIEGGEYELLGHVLSEGLVECITRLMIQWHYRFDGDSERQFVLQGRIADTHRMLWNYGAWEAWEKKGRTV